MLTKLNIQLSITSQHQIINVLHLAKELQCQTLIRSPQSCVPSLIIQLENAALGRDYLPRYKKCVDVLYDYLVFSLRAYFIFFSVYIIPQDIVNVNHRLSFHR